MNKKIVHLNDRYYIAKGDKENLSKKECLTYLKSLEQKNWNNLKDLLDQINSIYCVNVYQNNWKLSQCTCGFWQKHYKVIFK